MQTCMVMYFQLTESEIIVLRYKAVHSHKAVHSVRVSLSRARSSPRLSLSLVLLVSEVVVLAREVVAPVLDLGPRDVGHLHRERCGDAVLLGRPGREDGVLVGELLQVEPLDRDGVVTLDEPAWPAVVRLRVLLLRGAYFAR